MFGGLFGRKKKTPRELVREYKRVLDRTMRELERERRQLQRQETKLMGEIRKMARTGQQGAIRIMAQDLVRTRRYSTKFYRMKAQIQGVSLQLQTMQSTSAMTDSMKGVAGALGKMNRAMNLPATQRVMMEFQKQSEAMNMKEEMMGDTIDDALGDEDDEEESDALVKEIYDEIGLDMDGVAVKSGERESAKEDDGDLEARLGQLRKQ